MQNHPGRTRSRIRMALCVLVSFAPLAHAQVVGSSASGQEREPSPTSQSAPTTLTLQDALSLAQKNDPQLLGALGDAAGAAEDVRQSRASRYPSLSGRSEYLGTQGNGKLAESRFVTNDGVHVYREWAVLHQDFTAGIFTGTGIGRAQATEAVARAKAEVARRGLTPAVTKAYYALIVAQRKYGTAQTMLDQAKHSLAISQDLESGREVAHSDTVKFQLQEIAQEQAFREARLAIESSRLDLSALLFRDLNENFTIVDDLDKTPALPALAEAQGMAEKENPTVRAAMSALRGAGLDVTIARQAYLPSLGVDFVYGIEANAFALRSTVAADKRLGPLPNLGYFVTASLNIPVWDWGTRRSKVRQAELKQEQATVELSAAQRESLKNFRDYYAEAQTAREQVDLLRLAAELASESLRLNTLRYQAGEATVLELVDAETTLTQARNAYDDGMVRYRLALANLQTITGTF